MNKKLHNNNIIKISLQPDWRLCVKSSKSQVIKMQSHWRPQRSQHQALGCSCFKSWATKPIILVALINAWVPIGKPPTTKCMPCWVAIAWRWRWSIPQFYSVSVHQSFFFCGSLRLSFSITRIFQNRLLDLHHQLHVNFPNPNRSK